jgi:hypothetical protein
MTAGLGFKSLDKIKKNAAPKNTMAMTHTTLTNQSFRNLGCVNKKKLTATKPRLPTADQTRRPRRK